MKCKKGSVLLMTILVFSFVLITGFAVLSISITNYNIQHMNIKSKQCFYEAEGGLELVYGQIYREIENAIYDGKEKVDYFMKHEYEYLIMKETDKEKINERINEEFKKGYKNYFLGNKKVSFIRNIENIKSKKLKINLIDDNVLLEDNKIKFSVSSFYSEDTIQKEITQDFYIKVPNMKDKNIYELIEHKNWIRRK